LREELLDKIEDVRRQSDWRNGMAELRRELIGKVEEVRLHSDWRSSVSQLRDELLAKIEDARVRKWQLKPEEVSAISSQVTVEVLKYLSQYGLQFGAQQNKTSNLQDAGSSNSSELTYAQRASAFGMSITDASLDIRNGRYKEAVDVLMRFLQQDPADPVCRYYLAVALRHSGRLAEAETHAVIGARLERMSNNNAAISSRLERLQGPDRVWIEDFRLTVR
jgi:predicted Zn-dependent protease